MNDHQANELLPCPFCGSKDISDGEVLTTMPAGWTATQSMCRGCGALGPEAKLPEGECDFGDVRAIAAWNRRAAPTEPAVDRDAVHATFKAWAEDNLGQGYSLDMEEHTYVDPVTRWAFAAWRGRAALAAPASPAVPDLQSQLQTMRAAFHINMLRAYPGKTHDEITAAIDAAIGPASAPAVPKAKFDEAEFAEMVERGTKAWADVPDDWLEEYRGNLPEPTPPSPSVDQAKRLVGGEVAASLICTKCCIDRLEFGCTSAQCPMVGTAYSAPDRASTGSATSTDTKESA